MNQPNPQMQGMSEELARLAAEQEMIRQGMQQMLDQMKKDGQVGDDGLNEIMKDMKSKTTEAKHGDYASDVLCHHGVLGMKWGIRRYQPYPEGHTGGKEVGAAKRERKKLSKEQKAKIKTAAATTAAVATVAGSAAGAAKLYKMDKANAANVKNLSDEELKNANMRAGMEKAYSKNQGRSNLDKAQMLANTTQNTVNQLKNSNRQAMNDAKRNKPRMDLSKMTDQEMRSQINRELLERQYNDLFAPEPVDTGRQKVDKILNTTGDVLAIGSSALMIALAIKSFKG